MGLSFRDAARMSFHNLRRRRALFVFLALIVPSASLTVPVAMGSSFQESLREGILRSLGEIDLLVRSEGLMRMEVFDALKSDGALASATDGMAPALLVRAVLEEPSSGRRDPNVDILGMDGRSSSLGGFRDKNGARLPADIQPGEAYLSSGAAGRLKIVEGEGGRAVIQEPGYSLESVYSSTTGLHRSAFTVGEVLGGQGLGGLQLAPRGEPRRCAYVNLSWLQGQLGVEGINLVLISNTGDARRGVEGTSAVVERVNRVLDRSVGIQEGGYTLTATGSYVKLENGRIFFGAGLANKVRSSDARVRAVSPETSYFVNMIMCNGTHVAYSTVTAFDPAADEPFGRFTDNLTGLETAGDIADDEIILTDYTAARLGARVGDTVTINFTLYDRAFRQTLSYENFTVRCIVDLTGKADDDELMPPFPGIKGARSCGDWVPPIPINFSLMVSGDLAYWQSHGGAPKAYITLAEGMRLWGNDLGDVTTVKALPINGTSVEALAAGISSGLNATLDPAGLGVTVDPVKETALRSVRGLDIVTEALLAFASAVTISGMVLIIVVVQSNIEGRRREIGILRSLGFSRRAVAWLFTLEGAVLSPGAAAAGIVAGTGFSALGVWASNTVWSGVLPVKAALHLPAPASLALVFSVSLALCIISFAAGARAASRGSAVSNLRGLTEDTRHAGTGKTRSSWLRAVPLLCAVAAAALLVYFRSEASGENILLFYFALGDTLVLMLVFALYLYFGRLTAFLSRKARLGRIPLLYPARSLRRTTAYILVYALVVFPLLTLFSYVPLQSSQLSSQTELRGGGYDILGVTQAPVFFDIADAGERASHNITAFPEVAGVVPLLSFGAPGGTCSNLNSEAPPRLLGASPVFINESKIPFVESRDGSRGRAAWKLLDGPAGDRIPVISDYTTVVWILEKGLGGTIRITDESGRPAVLEIVAILHDSIFQGSVFISESNLRELYPTLAQYDHFLFKVKTGGGDSGGSTVEETASGLESSLAGFGLSARPVRDIVSDLVRFDLIYVSMLGAMMVSGVLLGTLGFSAKVAREVLERRHELGVMRAVGFRRGTLSALLLEENLFIFLLGFAVAWLSALVAASAFLGMVPPLAETGQLLLLLLAVIAGSTLLPLRRALRASPAGVLRTAE